jgi:hypothetical protein
MVGGNHVFRVSERRKRVTPWFIGGRHRRSFHYSERSFSRRVFHPEERSLSRKACVENRPSGPLDNEEFLRPAPTSRHFVTYCDGLLVVRY